MSYVKALFDLDNFANRLVKTREPVTKTEGSTGLIQKPFDLEIPEVETPKTPFSYEYLNLKALEERIQEAKDTGFADEGTGPSTVESTAPVRPRRNPKIFVANIDKIPERELLALTLQAEAGGEGYEGLLAAGAVIDNRAKSGKYGGGIKGVILKPGQFSAWNSVTGYANGEGGLDMARINPSEEAYKVADQILSGNYESPVGKATHYYNPNVATPKWGKEAGGDWQTVGNHIFGFAR